MGEIQVKKMRSLYLPQVYDLHSLSFPTPAKARYYEILLYEKESPFYVAINDDDEVIGYLATRIKRITKYSQGYSISSLSTDFKHPSLTIAAFTTKQGSDNEYEVEKVKSELMKTLMVQVRIGGYEKIEADIRNSNESSMNIFTDFGFSKRDNGTYRDGEEKIHYSYDFDIKYISSEFSIERAKYKHLNRIRMLHNQYLLAQKDYSYFSRLMQNKGGVMLAIVDEYGRVVGYLAARRQHKKTNDKDSPYTHLNFVSMAIDESVRGNKLGKALVEKMIFEARESDVEIIKGHVRESNTHARKLYKDLGFKESILEKYKDTNEDKIKISKRIRYPSIKPFIKPTLKNGSLVAVGYLIRAFQNK